ncbi:conserved hypothetical protein [Klebsiella variicola]|nr:conserved hypothetical protein [Klebsiella variicola]
MIINAWYSALDLQREDYPRLVHFSENGKYIPDKNKPDFIFDYHDLLKRLEYLTKVDSKVFGEGDWKFWCSRV